MSTLHIYLFGKFRVQSDDRPLVKLDTGKAQELFCYLLLHRSQPQTREMLATLLWEECGAAQAKKYLRQALWQLQSALDAPGDAILQTDTDWVQLNPAADIQLDVVTFEQAFAKVQGMLGHQLTAAQVSILDCAVALYTGDLLEGLYRDWHLYERERLRVIYLAMLDRLIGYCEAHQEYDRGLTYATTILRYDRAREHTHRQLMRLYYQGGDRTAALRQYESCVTALAEELDVEPANSTRALYEQIRIDRFEPPSASPPQTDSTDPQGRLPDVLVQLVRLQTLLQDVELQLQVHIHRVERILVDEL